MSDCKPRIKPTLCPEGVPSYPMHCPETVLAAPVPQRDGGPVVGDECCPNDNVERGWYNAPLVLSCELPSIGTPVRVPYAAFHSVMSQEAANQAALDYAELQLNCVIPHYYSQEYTLSCPDITVPNGTGEFSFVSRTSSPTLLGISENTGYVSLPPKKFLRCTGSGSITYTLYWGVPPVLLVTTLGVTEIDPITGSATSLLTVSSSNNGNPPSLLPSVRAWEGNFGSYGQSCPVFLESNTTAYRRFSHSYANPELVPNYATQQFWDKSQDDHITDWMEYGYYPASSTGTLYDTLSNENTEEDALARTAYTTGINSTASRTLRGAGEFTFTAVRVFATANLSGLQSGVEYVLSYNRTTTNAALSTSVVEPVALVFTASAASEAIDLGEIPCAPGYSAFVSGLSVVPVNPIVSGNSITVPAGQFESIVSQADADAQAEAYAEANLVCEDPPLSYGWNNPTVGEVSNSPGLVEYFGAGTFIRIYGIRSDLLTCQYLTTISTEQVDTQNVDLSSIINGVAYREDIVGIVITAVTGGSEYSITDVMSLSAFINPTPPYPDSLVTPVAGAGPFVFLEGNTSDPGEYFPLNGTLNNTSWTINWKYLWS